MNGDSDSFTPEATKTEAMKIGERIKEARERKGLTQQALATELGVSRGAVGNWEKENSNDPEAHRLNQLGEILGVSVDWLTGKGSVDELPDPPEQPNARMAGEIRLRETSKVWKTIPVMGTAQAGPNGAFEVNMGEPIEHTRRPSGLEGIKDAYAIYVEGDSMWPKFEPGQLIFIHARRPPALNRDVVIQIRPNREGEAPPAYLKRLIRKSPDEIEVTQFNPPKKRVFKLADVLSIHLVLREDELI